MIFYVITQDLLRSLRSNLSEFESELKALRLNSAEEKKAVIKQSLADAPDQIRSVLEVDSALWLGASEILQESDHPSPDLMQKVAFTVEETEELCQVLSDRFASLSFLAGLIRESRDPPCLIAMA